MNLGQLALLLRAKYLVDVQSHTQVRGLPFTATSWPTCCTRRPSIAADAVAEGVSR